MTSKEYLSQAFRLDECIRTKMTQIESLNALAEKCTSVLSDMPKSPNRAVKSMEDTIAKIVDLQTELDSQMKALVSLKKEIMGVIQQVGDCECRLLLEKRYLCFMKWETIAVEMHYTHRWVTEMHGKALREVDRIRNQN